MSDDSLELSYASGDDGETEDVPVAKKRRGEGRSWTLLGTHRTVAEGVIAMEAHNDPVVTRLKGRRNRGVSVAYYWNCAKKSCGCQKEWRISTSMFSPLVCEEESVGEHSCHELFERNGGRGLSYLQVEILNGAVALGILKSKELIEHFKLKAAELLATGITNSHEHVCGYYLFLLKRSLTERNTDPSAGPLKIPSSQQITNYLAAEKRRQYSNSFGPPFRIPPWDRAPR